jgi:hypothetical protein
MAFSMVGAVGLFAVAGAEFWVRGAAVVVCLEGVAGGELSGAPTGISHR